MKHKLKAKLKSPKLSQLSQLSQSTILFYTVSKGHRPKATKIQTYKVL